MKTSIAKESEKFLAYLKDIRGYSEQTIRTYQIALTQMLELTKIEQEEGVHIFNIMPLRLHIASQNKKTISKKLSAIRSFKEYLEDNGYTIMIKGDGVVKTPKTLPKPISDEHIREALGKADSEERLIVLLLYSLGLRISELASLRLDSIGPEWVRVVGKGNKTREIPILPELQNAIRLHIERTGCHVYLFEKDGEKLSENSLRYMLTKLFKKIGIKATPHQLRHAFATELLNNGARILDVKDLLGHSSLQTTEIYTKLNNSLKLKSYLSAHPLCQEDNGEKS